ncbi:Lsr2 family protein [Sanguibacter sp. 4.1]|uniref:Lsr2 family protein n=1 Tax=Sanguibacter biliveldensis TaxID=3030830 RepID=A0AAF1C417_9MICO|nr:Lsr2 family protein [Sanguibacter sp. 4.1]WPF83599.1 Lsr2 family protein [Sanguibacter sp. 4.1]
MAQHTKVVLTDDLDGGPATETVRFGLDGSEYEIDLSAQNAHALRDALAQHVGHGRKSSSLGSTRGFTRVVTGHDPAALRAWADARGIALPARGKKIPDDVVAQYRAAGN